MLAVLPAPQASQALASLQVPDASLVAPLHGGHEALLWTVRTPTGPAVLRILPPGTRGQAHRERIAMSLAETAALSVPRLLACGTWKEHQVLLMEHLAGQTCSRFLRTHPWLAGHVGEALATAQILIHSVPASVELQHASDDWIAWAEGERDLVDLLRSVARHDRLVHFDLHPANVLWSGGRISGVLDWGNAQAGDPRADLARSIAFLHLMPLSRGPAGALATATRRSLASSWNRQYHRLSPPVDDMAPFLAWAGAVFARDFRRQLGKAPHLRPRHLHAARIWTSHWKERAGVR